jgi:STE24 endopeptidase
MERAIVAVVLAFFAAELAVEVGLAALNARHVRRAPPPAGDADPAAAARSRAYTVAKARLGIAHAVYGSALTLAVLLSGALGALDRALRGAGLEGAHLFVAFLAALSALFAAAHLPFRLYGTFVVEERFGFNRTTAARWWLDRAKALGLSAAIGVPVLYATWLFMARTGAAWWIWLSAFFAAFQLFLVWIYPSVIAPVFNRFVPLPEGPLRARLERLAAAAGFRTRGVFVMDASRRSGHSNAYFMGFLRPRIVLYDTLVEQLSVDEAAAVLAHEIGHYRRRHVHRRLASGLAFMTVGFWVLSLLASWPPLFAAFRLAGPSPHAALAIFVLASGAFTFALSPVSSWLSRRHEYEADRFAIGLAGAPALRAALTRLNRQNLADVQPHPWHSAWHDSHPALAQRLAAIDRAEAAAGAPAASPA